VLVPQWSDLAAAWPWQNFLPGSLPCGEAAELGFVVWCARVSTRR
jgi:hypothetical protein